MPLAYTYFVGALLSLIPWVVIFLLRKDLRKIMLLASAFLGVYGVLFEYFWWTRDWWHPFTITHTRVGIEDFTTAWSVGGIIVVLYLLLFKKKIKRLPKLSGNIVGAILILLLQVGLMVFFTTLLKVTSFYATMMAYVVSGVILLCLRKDVLKATVITAVVTLVGSVCIYLVLFALTPNFVSQTWTLKNLSGAYFLGIPIEDVFFFFLLAMFYVPWYWYANNEELVRKG